MTLPNIPPSNSLPVPVPPISNGVTKRNSQSSRSSPSHRRSSCSASVGLKKIVDMRLSTALGTAGAKNSTDHTNTLNIQGTKSDHWTSRAQNITLLSHPLCASSPSVPTLNGSMIQQHPDQHVSLHHVHHQQQIR